MTTRGIELSTLTGTPTSVPQKAAQILLSDRDRHVIAFGADGLGEVRLLQKVMRLKTQC